MKQSNNNSCPCIHQLSHKLIVSGETRLNYNEILGKDKMNNDNVNLHIPSLLQIIQYITFKHSSLHNLFKSINNRAVEIGRLHCLVIIGVLSLPLSHL